jgi:hypothetical protein
MSPAPTPAAPWRGVLVTGSHRAGTTWVGRLLVASGELGYIDEPFNVVKEFPWVVPPFPHQFLHVHDANAAVHGPALRRAAEFRFPLAAQMRPWPGIERSRRLAKKWALGRRARLQHRRPLFKDPIALFSAPWLAAELGLRPLLLVRHPAAFAGSLKRLGWTFDFRNWSEQPSLLDDLLAPYADDIRRFAVDPPDVIEQAILQWNAMYAVVGRFATEHPDWLVRRYEDLARNPLAQFRTLYAELGLTFDAAAERTVRELSEGDAQAGAAQRADTQRAMELKRNAAEATTTWTRRLTADEIDRVRAGTAAVASRWYGDDAW